MQFVKCIVVAAALLAVSIEQGHALASPNDLGFDGAAVNELAQGGGFVYAAVDGPKGIFVSDDFGTTWRFASGGSYNVGRGVDLLTTSTRVFAILGKKVFYSSFSLAPQWQELDLGFSAGSSSGAFVDPEKPNSLATDGTFLFVSSNYGKVRSVSLASLTLLDTSTLPEVTEPVNVPRLAPVGSNRIFAFKGKIGGASGRVFRTTYDSSSGVFSTWGERTPDAIKGDGGRIGGVFSNGSGTVYVTTFGGGPASQRFFKSTDGGDTFSAVAPSLPAGASFKIRGAKFRGSTHIVGGFISGNDGNDFEALPFPTTSSGASINGVAMLIDQNDSNMVMSSSAIGPLVTTDADNAGSSSWQARTRGLRGMNVFDMAQSSDLSITVLGIATGIARSKDFATASVSAKAVPTFNFPIVPVISGSKVVEAIRAVAIDPDNSNVVYVGGSKLYKVVFDSQDSPTWSVIHAPSPSTLDVSDIVVLGDKIVVSFLQTVGSLNGKIMIFNRSTLAEETTALDGYPVRVLTSATNSVLYAGVGGNETAETEDVTTDRGLFRSADAGLTWKKIETNDALKYAGVNGLAYDFFDDLLYVSGNGFKTGETAQDVGLGDREESGNVFLIKKASRSKPTVALPRAGIDTTKKVTALTIATKDNSQNAYVTQGSKVLVSNGNGDAWALLYEGLEDDQTNLLFFDDLVQNSDAGLNTLQGNPNLVVSGIPEKISALSKKKIEITLSKEVVDSATNRRKVRARMSGNTLRIAKRNETALLVLPRGKWPSSGTVRVTVSSELQAKDGEALDSDYDGVQGGKSLKRNVKISR